MLLLVGVASNFVEVFFVGISVALGAPGVVGVCGVADIIVASFWYCRWFLVLLLLLVLLI